MGSDVWMRPLGPVAAEGAAWLHFHSVAEALRFLHSEAGGSLRHLKHTQVARAAKSDGTRDGYSFTFKEPMSTVWPMLNSCFPWDQGVCPLAVLLGSLTF